VEIVAASWGDLFEGEEAMGQKRELRLADSTLREAVVEHEAPTSRPTPSPEQPSFDLHFEEASIVTAEEIKTTESIEASTTPVEDKADDLAELPLEEPEVIEPVPPGAVEAAGRGATEAHEDPGHPEPPVLVAPDATEAMLAIEVPIADDDEEGNDRGDATIDSGAPLPDPETEPLPPPDVKEEAPWAQALAQAAAEAMVEASLQEMAESSDLDSEGEWLGAAAVLAESAATGEAPTPPPDATVDVSVQEALEHRSAIDPARDAKRVRGALEDLVDGKHVDPSLERLALRTIAAILLDEGLFDADRLERVLEQLARRERTPRGS
jgi:hypothetical protein